MHPAKDKRNYTLVFVLLMLSKLAAGGWAGDLCSALVWPGLLAIEYGHGRPVQRPLQLVCISEALRLLFWLLTPLCGHERPCLLDEHHVRAAGLRPGLGGA